MAEEGGRWKQKLKTLFKKNNFFKKKVEIKKLERGLWSKKMNQYLLLDIHTCIFRNKYLDVTCQLIYKHSYGKVLDEFHRRVSFPNEIEFDWVDVETLGFVEFDIGVDEQLGIPAITTFGTRHTHVMGGLDDHWQHIHRLWENNVAPLPRNYWFTYPDKESLLNVL